MTQINGMQVEISIAEPRVVSVNELRIRVAFTNATDRNIRLNGLFLNMPQVLLKVRKRNLDPVYPGPPGMPPPDDGESGRVNLPPGKPLVYEYLGSQYFGTAVAPGQYQVCFHYENNLPGRGDWTGVVETDWIDFEVVAPNRKA